MSRSSVEVKLIDVEDQIHRFPEHSKGEWLPRPGLPDFTKPGAWEIVEFARLVRQGDKLHEENFRVIPFSLEEFRASPAGQYFAGELPRSAIGEKGENVLRALSRGVLDIVGAAPEGVTLMKANFAGDETPVGYLSFKEYDPLAKEYNKLGGIYQIRRLASILVHPDDPYWDTLVNYGIIFQNQRPNQNQLDEVRQALMPARLARTNWIYVNPHHRDKGVGTKLVQSAYGENSRGGVAVVTDSTNQLREFMLMKTALKTHQTSLAPGIDEGQSLRRIADLALQAVLIYKYQAQFHEMERQGNPTVKFYSPMRMVGEVAQILKFNREAPVVEPEAFRESLRIGLDRRILSLREAKLFAEPAIDLTHTQFPIISIPTRLGL